MWELISRFAHLHLSRFPGMSIDTVISSSSSASSSSYRTMSFILSRSPAMLMSNSRINVLETVSRPANVWFPIFCNFCKPVIVISCLHDPSMPVSFDFGPFYDMLNLANVANPIPQSIASEVFTSIVLDSRLQLFRSGIINITEILIRKCPKSATQPYPREYLISLMSWNQQDRILINVSGSEPSLSPFSSNPIHPGNKVRYFKTVYSPRA